MIQEEIYLDIDGQYTRFLMKYYHGKYIWLKSLDPLVAFGSKSGYYCLTVAVLLSDGSVKCMQRPNLNSFLHLTTYFKEDNLGSPGCIFNTEPNRMDLWSTSRASQNYAENYTAQLETALQSFFQFNGARFKAFDEALISQQLDSQKRRVNELTEQLKRETDLLELVTQMVSSR